MRLIEDARTPMAEMAKSFKVATGTIHQRIERLKKEGIIQGTRAIVDHKKLGLDVCCFIGVNLKSAGDYPVVIQNLNLFKEVVEAYYTTGNYSLFIKVVTESITDLHTFLTEKLQAVTEIQSTETFISLNNPIQRDFIP